MILFTYVCTYFEDIINIIRHNVAEILLKLALNTNQSINQSTNITDFHRNEAKFP